MALNREGEPGQTPTVLTVAEAAELLGISRNLAYQGVHSGELPSLKVGNRILVPRRAVLLTGPAPAVEHCPGRMTAETLVR